MLKCAQGVFANMTAELGLPAGVATSFAEDAQGALYIGFQEAGIVKIQRGVKTLYNTVNGLPEDQGPLPLPRPGRQSLGGHEAPGPRGPAAGAAPGGWFNPTSWSSPSAT